MSEQFDPRMDEIARAIQKLGQATIEAMQAVCVALQPVAEAFGAWYVSLSSELQAALSGRPLNRRRVVRAQKMRRYRHYYERQ